MKNIVRVVAFLLGACTFTNAQENSYTPDLASAGDKDTWSIHNRELKVDNGVHLNAQPGDGLLWLKNFEFENGVIELDVRGLDKPGQSFVGLAFHIENDSTFDAVYFRAFNFQNPERNNHSVQYISHPEYTWSKLREEYPGKYENTVQPIPDPDDWFSVRIEVDFPEVKVYMDKSKSPSLEVKQISTRGKGSIGFWVGNNSEGSFRNLKITSN